MNQPFELTVAALRRKGNSEDRILALGDVFVELRLSGKNVDYFIPIDLWDFLQLLTQISEPNGESQCKASGEAVLARLQKTGVGIARYQAWRLSKQMADWPNHDLILAAATHRGQLLEKAHALLAEPFYRLKFSDLQLGIPGGLSKTIFRFASQNNLSIHMHRENRELIKVDYRMEMESPPADLVLA